MPASSHFDSARPWFQCQRCGNCCRWPGDVHVSETDLSAIAGHLGISAHAFVQDYTRIKAKRTGLSIIDKPDGECVFLQCVNTCAIQAVKPAHCQGFPHAWNFPGWREVCEAVEVAKM